jgi:hypothetical protein
MSVVGTAAGLRGKQRVSAGNERVSIERLRKPSRASGLEVFDNRAGVQPARWTVKSVRVEDESGGNNFGGDIRQPRAVH